MLKHPIIMREYIDKFQTIKYLGEVQDLKIDQESLNEDSIIANHGHHFQLLASNEESLNLTSEDYEVIGWIEKTEENPFDFIIYDREQNVHYLAQLHGRNDGWPLFSVQPEGYVCARSKMGSEWSCLKCIKYFGTVCKAR